ncbi:MAG: hypothetical protein FWH54_06765 [Methanobrevibacter sp.]|nr:hypothetical protein [Methanobrevibacter sp.]
MYSQGNRTLYKVHSMHIKDDLIAPIEYIKKLPEELKKNRIQLENKEDVHNFEAVEKKKNSFENFLYDRALNDVYQKTEKFLIKLKNIPLMNEYYSFLEIQTMIKTILDKNVSDIDNKELHFLNNVLDVFIKHIDNILKLDKSVNLSKLSENEEYLNVYDVFRKTFFDYQMKFYTEIASPDDKFNNIVQQLYDSINL